jgi:hypothetical protein
MNYCGSVAAFFTITYTPAAERNPYTCSCYRSGYQLTELLSTDNACFTLDDYQMGLTTTGNFGQPNSEAVYRLSF